MNGTGIDLNELAVFGAVATRRSFTGGARILRAPKATVSRKVRALESRLGVQLLQRTTRKVTLTEAGEALLVRWRLIEEQLEDADAAVGRLRGTPRGLLRVAAPPTLMAEWLAPLAAQFLARHPGVRIELLTRSEPVELVGRGADLAVTHGPQVDSSQVTRLVGELPTSVYAARTYLARHPAPQVPQELADHATLFLAPSPLVPREWRLRHGRREVVVPLAPRLVANDLRPLLAGLRAGTGLLVAPHLSVAAALAAEEVVPVLPGWKPPPLEFRVVFSTRLAIPPRVRLFIDLLAERGAALSASQAAGPVAPFQPDRPA
jgi:DNA-binding transcriptional LysR family regulator